MKNGYAKIIKPLSFCGILALVACSNSKLQEPPPLEFGTKISAITSIPTQVAPNGTDEPTVTPTFTWDLADNNADTFEIWVAHTGGIYNPTALTPAALGCAGCADFNVPNCRCSHTVPGGEELGGGNATWWIRARDADDSSTTGWSGGVNFSVQATAVATLVSPTAGNTPSTSFNPPDFTWAPVASSGSYTLWIGDSVPNNNTADWEVTYTPAQAGCADGVTNCVLTGAFLGGEGLTLNTGRVDWFIQTSNGNWSAEGQFTLVDACGGEPLGTSCDDGNDCTTDSCDTGTFPDGRCVNTNNIDACNDGNACTTGDICDGTGSCRAADQVTCTVANGAATPTGDNADPNADYSWPEVAGVLNYRVFVRNRDTSATVLDQNVAAATACVGGTCTLEPGTLQNGRYSWWVQTPPLTDGCCTQVGNVLMWHGPWMTGVDYTVGHEQPTLIAPLDIAVITDTTPTLTWNAVSGSNHTYDVWVTDSTGNSTESTITEAAAACIGGGTCQFTVGAPLPLGRTRWWVEANNSGTWSARGEFQLE